ncbi:U-box domain-containing protein 41 [Raphanus sativus]|uniref:RING-type E3 ubiquitin transferase n=1 Tax=Raphanus sativus TaxID=3726 RepID=A0A6J0LDQ2_RAPSA|nr:U-box domain-containing protein 41-like [Raphanus sativus]KAJ4873919.1 U-box domain-containing protein 41 [Raphanus sativus]
MGGNNRQRWFSFHQRSASATATTVPQHKHDETPPEFLCPITGFLMSDPVVVPSGQTFERLSVQICRNLSFVPDLLDGTRPDFSAVIPNLAMKSTIFGWCDRKKIDRPRPPDAAYVENVVRARMDKDPDPNPNPDPGRESPVNKDEILLPPVAENSPSDYDTVMELIRARSKKPITSSPTTSSSVESVTIRQSPFFPTRAVTMFSSSSTTSSSSEIYAGSFSFSDHSSSSSPAMSPEEEEIYNKLRAADIFDHEQGLILLRKMTRSSEDLRVSLCTDRILSFLRQLLVSRYNLVQTNAAASLVNLSLEKRNKVRIVRSGFVPLLIDVLKSGTAEAQEHVAGALFSLALEDENKMVIGVLGAVEPLLHALRSSESERAKGDAALALYHLSLIPSNRTRLVRAGAVATLLSMVRSGESISRILLVLCNIAACPDGKSAMLEGNAVGILVGKLREGGGGEDEAARENCVGVLLTLCQGNLRFRGLASEAGAEEVLKEVEESGNARVKEKAGKILQAMRGGGESEYGENAEAREWNRMIEATGLSRTQFACTSQF